MFALEIVIKKLLNCAPVLALVAGGLAAATPASAATFDLSPSSVSAGHDMLKATSLMGDGIRGPLSSRQQQQQQQQQQRRNFVAEAGLVYGAPLSGFNV